MRKILAVIAILLFVSNIHAQEQWDLRRCVEYALENNISVKQTDLQSRFSELTLKQGKASQLPTFNFGSNAGYRFGLSDNPTTGILENNNFFNAGMQLQSSVTLFNWFAMRYANESNRLTFEADNAQTEKIKNDIALNVAVAYLQVLLAREQISLAQIRMQQTSSQLESILKQVEAETLPELNAAQMDAQYAADTAAFIGAKANAERFLLQLKALLNLDAATVFDIVTPPVDQIPLEPLADLQPESVYASALVNLPQQKVNNLRIEAAQQDVKAARASMYPVINAFAGLSTSYVNFKKRPIYNQVVTGYSTTPFIVDAGGGNVYEVKQPIMVNGNNVISYFKSDALGTQLKENFGQNIGIGLNVPIFNGLRARTSWQQSQLQVQNLQLTKDQAEQTLKQDIYNAYIDATAALSQFNANQKGVEAAEKAYEFAIKRNEQGLLSIYELQNAQNALQTARTQFVSAQFDYVFKMKLLEFYKGQGLKL